MQDSKSHQQENAETEQSPTDLSVVSAGFDDKLADSVFHQDSTEIQPTTEPAFSSVSLNLDHHHNLLAPISSTEAQPTTGSQVTITDQSALTPVPPTTSAIINPTQSLTTTTTTFEQETDHDDCSSSTSESSGDMFDEEDDSFPALRSDTMREDYFSARSRRKTLRASDILSLKKNREEAVITREPSSSILVVNEAINSYPSVNEMTKSVNTPRGEANDESPSQEKVYSSIIFESKHDSKRIKLFEDVLTNYQEFVSKNPNQFRKMIREGIPTKELLKAYWKRMLGSEELPNKYPGLYKKLAQHDNILDDDTQKILKDVHRTYPQYEYFSEKDGPGQQTLIRILKAYCYFDTQTGYCQGMAFICGFALMNLEDEEDTFWFFVQIMNNTKHALKDIFSEGLPKLRLIMFMISELMNLRLPEVHKYLESQYILPEMYASSFLMTVCTNRFSFVSSQRIWSIFLNEGWKIMVRLIVGLFKYTKKEIFGLNATEVTTRMYEIAEKSDIDILLKYAFSVRLTSRLMHNMTIKYESCSLSEQEKKALKSQRETQRKIRSNSQLFIETDGKNKRTISLPSVSSIFAKFSNFIGLVDSREEDGRMFDPNEEY